MCNVLGSTWRERMSSEYPRDLLLAKAHSAQGVLLYAASPWRSELPLALPVLQ